MEALLTGAAIFGAIVLSRIIEPAIYRFNQRNEAVDHLTQERWNIVKHTDLNYLRQDFAREHERLDRHIDKLNEAVFPEEKRCAVLKSTNEPLASQATPRSI